MKKLFALLVAFVLVSMSASAAVIEFTIGDVQYCAEKDGRISNRIIEAAPVIEDGRTLVPVRAISDAFGMDIDWDENARLVTLKNAENEIKLYIGSKTAYVNASELSLDVAPVIENGRTLVPLRFVSEALGYNVNYVNTTRQVVIDDTPAVIECGDKKITIAEFDALFNAYKSISQRPEDYSDEEFEDLIVETALRNFYEIALLSRAFSDMEISDADKEYVKEGVDEMYRLYTPEMKALSTLVFEKYFLWNTSNIVNYIEKNIDLEDFYQSEFVRAKHILTEDEKTAKEAYEKALSGEDFDELIKEYGQDPGTESNPDGYVFTKGEMIEEFESTAFGLKAGEISSPVKSSYGYHIVKREPLPQLTAEIKQNVSLYYGQARLDAGPDAKYLLDTDEIKALLK